MRRWCRLICGFKYCLFTPNAIYVGLPQSDQAIAPCRSQGHSAHVPFQLPYLENYTESYTLDRVAGISVISHTGSAHVQRCQMGLVATSHYNRIIHLLWWVLKRNLMRGLQYIDTSLSWGESSATFSTVSLPSGSGSDPTCHIAIPL